MNSLQKFVTFFVLASILSSGVLAAEDLIHVVGRGETIYSISRFYRVSAEDLMRVNGITDPSKLQAGRRLTIPSTAFSDVSTSTQALVDYRIVRGDTLYSIARSHDISLQSLLEINKFQPNHVIRAGDVIKVPGSTVAQNNPVASGAATADASLRWPVNSRGVAYMTGQMGVIVEGEYSESVKSLTQGRVISAGPWRKFDRVVIVEAAGGYFYMYGGCETLSVSVGDSITPGMELGKLSVNAVSERAQLFFMVFRGDTPIDPAKAPRAANNART